MMSPGNEEGLLYPVGSIELQIGHESGQEITIPIQG